MPPRHANCLKGRGPPHFPVFEADGADERHPLSAMDISQRAKSDRAGSPVKGSCGRQGLQAYWRLSERQKCSATLLLVARGLRHIYFLPEAASLVNSPTQSATSMVHDAEWNRDRRSEAVIVSPCARLTSHKGFQHTTISSQR